MLIIVGACAELDAFWTLPALVGARLAVDDCPRLVLAQSIASWFVRRCAAHTIVIAGVYRSILDGRKACVPIGAIGKVAIRGRNGNAC